MIVYISSPDLFLMSPGVYRFDGNPFQEYGPLIVGTTTLGKLEDGVPIHTEGIGSTVRQSHIATLPAATRETIPLQSQAQYIVQLTLSSPSAARTVTHNSPPGALYVIHVFM